MSEGFPSFTHTVVTSFRSSYSLKHFSPLPIYLVPLFSKFDSKPHNYTNLTHTLNLITVPPLKSYILCYTLEPVFHWVYSLLMPQAHVTEEAVSNGSSPVLSCPLPKSVLEDVPAVHPLICCNTCNNLEK